MDDHIYNEIIDYAECYLFPSFRAEYAQCHKLTACPSYGEVKACCTALNAIAPYAGYKRITPRSIIDA